MCGPNVYSKTKTALKTRFFGGGEDARSTFALMTSDGSTKNLFYSLGLFPTLHVHSATSRVDRVLERMHAWVVPDGSWVVLGLTKTAVEDSGHGNKSVSHFIP